MGGEREEAQRENERLGAEVECDSFTSTFVFYDAKGQDLLAQGELCGSFIICNCFILNVSS